MIIPMSVSVYACILYALVESSLSICVWVREGMFCKGLNSKLFGREYISWR